MTDDPEYLLARAEYLFPDSDDPGARMAMRIQAAARMRDLEAAAAATVS